MSTVSWAKELANQLLAHGEVSSLLRDEANTPREWRIFRESWSDLPVDGFMANGETYRRRRHSLFNVDSDGHIVELPKRPYLQTKDINHLNGGVERTYEQIIPEVTETALFRELLTSVTSVLTELHGSSTWHHQCFQNRITTSPEQVGNPTPEGIHRDGVDYVVTLLVDRTNIQGGSSRIYETSSGRLLHEQTLQKQGEMLLADDERTLHEATPIARIDPSRPGHRDVFIDVITQSVSL